MKDLLAWFLVARKVIASLECRVEPAGDPGKEPPGLTHCWWPMFMNRMGLRGRLPSVFRVFSQEHARLHAVSLWSSMIFKIDKLVRMELNLIQTAFLEPQMLGPHSVPRI